MDELYFISKVRQPKGQRDPYIEVYVGVTDCDALFDETYKEHINRLVNDHFVNSNIDFPVKVNIHHIDWFAYLYEGIKDG